MTTGGRGGAKSVTRNEEINPTHTETVDPEKGIG